MRTSLAEALSPRPQFPERLAIAVPRGFGDKLRARAKASGVTVSELTRQAIAHLTEPPPAPVLQHDGNPVTGCEELQKSGCDHTLVSVPAHCVADVWSPELVAMIADGNGKLIGSRFPVDVLRQACENCRHQLWLGRRSDGTLAAAAFTGIFTEPDGEKTLEWVLAVGSDFPSWAWMMEPIEVWAVAQGAVRARMYGRRGWRKVLPDAYRAKGTIFVKELARG